jgi:hypothetical protein
MKASKKWLVLFLPAILIAGIAAGWALMPHTSANPFDAPLAMAAKDEDKPLPASDEVPDDIAKLEKDKDKDPKDKDRKRPSKRELLDKVAKQAGGKEKIDKAKGKKAGDMLEASDRVPDAIEQLEKDKEKNPKDKDRKRPSKKELLDRVAKQPGGKEKIEKAEKHGTETGMGRDQAGLSFAWLSSLNPFKAEAAKAQGAFALTLTPEVPVTSGGAINFYGELSGSAQAYPNRVKLSYHYDWTGDGARGLLIVKPTISVSVRVPTTGWYLLNFEFIYGQDAHLAHFSGKGMRSVQTWNQYGETGWSDHPVVLYLAAGWHYFYFVQDRSSNNYFYAFTISDM